VRRELPRWGATRPCLRIVRAVYAAAADPAGVLAQRPGALERAQLAMADWHDTRERLARTQTRMVAVLDELGLTELVMTIAGLTPVGAAAILAKTGDPARFATPRSLDWYAGLCPRDNASGRLPGQDLDLWPWPAGPAGSCLAGGAGGVAALAACRHHPAGPLGSGDRRRRHIAAARSRVTAS
jgi:Transposase IS116/IS110/IS902 family